MAPLRVNVFTIPPATPFLARFVSALMAGEIVAGFPDSEDPLALASATILVPTQRAAQALRETFVAQRAGPAMVLPRIQTFGQLSDVDSEFDEGGAEGTDLLPPCVAVPERRLVLMQLIARWAAALKGPGVEKPDVEVSGVEENVGSLVAAAPAHAFRLAGDLAALIDEMEIEGVPWDRLDKVAPEEFDQYWKLTLDFLKIATGGWRDYLAATGLIDRVARQALIIEAQIARLEASLGGPIIAIGSTGTNRSTARLLGALARSPRGAVVLPGLDLELDDDAWALIAGDTARRIEPSAGHPQAALHRLLRELKIERADVLTLAAAEGALAARHSFLTQALRPADTTDIWASLRATRDPQELEAGLAGVALIEAEDEREEALSLAVVLRDVLETPSRTGILITPDRGLAMRVRAELARWGVEVDDSAGEPLRMAPLGSLARRLLDLAAGEVRASDLLALVAHPMLRLGRRPEEVRRLAQLVEIGVARVLLPASASALALAQAARETAQERHSHAARRAISDADWDAMEGLLGALDAALVPLRALQGRASLGAWVAAHRTALAHLAEAPDEPARPEEAVLARLFDAWSGAHAERIALSAYDYSVLFDQALQEETVRPVRPAHPRLQILGLLEARLIRADVVLLGGLDETVWPPQSQTGAFLNRPMRAQLGLSPPERRIGQTAHDFVQALGAPQVVISRARKRGGSPTVTSRILQRMAALAGPAWTDVLSRGARHLALARGLETPRAQHATSGGGRPAPRPPIDLRPRKLSVTRIELLRRDPYSVYAESILGLRPLDPVGPEAGIRESGILLHEVIARFSGSLEDDVPPDASARIHALAAEAFATFLAAPDFRTFHWPRILAALDAYVTWERERRGGIAKLLLERKGSLTLRLFDGSDFTLTAEADRIEQWRDGTLVVLDFKSGRVPSQKEVAAGFAPQLVLEAAMLKEGAFPDVDLRDVSRATYVKLGGEDGLTPTDVGGKQISLADLVPDQFEGLRILVEQFRNVETAYVSRPYPQFVTRYGRYDHLARVKEWSSTIEEG